jgi:hypothetical protein
LITSRPLGHFSRIVGDRTVRSVTDSAANSLVSVRVRVHGGNAAAPSPGWAGPAVLAGGLLLVAAGGVVEIRGRRRRARRAFPS